MLFRSIAVADEMLTVNPQDALAQKIRLQALFDKKDYAGVFENKVFNCAVIYRAVIETVSSFV